MGNNGFVVNPENLEDWATKGLVIRALQHTEGDRGFPHGKSKTTILVFCIGKVGVGKKARRILGEVEYKLVEPVKGYPTGLSVKLHGTDPEEWGKYFEEVVIPDWKERIPEWRMVGPALTVRRGPYGAKDVAIARSGIMYHWQIFQVRAAYERGIQTTGESEMLSHIHDRMVTFNRENLLALTRTSGI